MKKVALEIIGLSYSQTQTGAYALVLGESAGSRRLPIIIGSFEAQSIAIEMEKMTPSRPLTHDLFRAFADAFHIKITEVVIYNLLEGIFYARIVCDNGQEIIELDSRTSDAIALAVRFSCPIYTYEFILGSAGILVDDPDEEDAAAVKEKSKPSKSREKESNALSQMTLDQLENLLNQAIEDENYERASHIRDEIQRRKSGS
jgi:bifunctional DNase/RNase